MSLDDYNAEIRAAHLVGLRRLLALIETCTDPKESRLLLDTLFRLKPQRPPSARATPAKPSLQMPAADSITPAHRARSTTSTRTEEASERSEATPLPCGEGKGEGLCGAIHSISPVPPGASAPSIPHSPPTPSLHPDLPAARAHLDAFTQEGRIDAITDYFILPWPITDEALAQQLCNRPNLIHALAYARTHPPAPS